MDLGLKGKRALVMGASTGLGRGVAEAYIAEGAKVAICARNKEKLEATKEAIGADLAISTDLSEPGAAKQLVEQVTKEFGGVDMLVINTGGPAKGLFPDISDDQWQLGFQSLWLSAVDSIKAALPNMKENNWGRILLITSIAAKEPIPQLTVSNGLRAGLLGLARSVSHEVAESGITINSILPGYTETERLQELGVDLGKIAEQIPARRLGTTQELGALAAFLSSNQAGYITGQTISIDGGHMKGI